jgi:hypothetical protein
MMRQHREPAPTVQRARLEVVRKDTAAPPRVSAPPKPPDAEAARARQLVDSWIATTFIAAGDAVEDLVRRIAFLLAERDGGRSDRRR